MDKNMRKFCKSFGALFFSVLFVFVVFGVTVHAVELTPEQEAYKKAVEDAKETTQAEISRELLAVVPRVDVVNYRRLQGDNIIWEDPDHPDESRVLVVSFMSKKTYAENYEKHMEDDPYQLKKSLWVTVVPEMSSFFIGKECPPTPNRLIKALGLNPEQCAAFDVLVEMWVDPKYLYRPTPDPEITDHEAELATRISDSDYWIYPSDMNPFLLIDPYALVGDLWALPKTFKEWYRDLAASKYNTTGEDVNTWGYPWTRLGYTYDWGNADNHVGLSEFIIRINPYAEFVYVKLKRAVIFDKNNPDEWNKNFRCGPKAPMMALKADSSGISIVWTSVQDADGYYVRYKATERGKPFKPPFENEIDVGDTTEFKADLSSGDSFHVAIQAYSKDGRGGISNIEYFHIP